jgi:hypothetical protein
LTRALVSLTFASWNHVTDWPKSFVLSGEPNVHDLDPR